MLFCGLDEINKFTLYPRNIVRLHVKTTLNKIGTHDVKLKLK